MRTLLVLICSLALASFALSAEEGKGKKKEEPKKKAAHAGQVSQPAGKGPGKPTAVGHPAGGHGPSEAGKPQITRCFEIIRPNGTTGLGGRATTAASFSYSVAGITGTLTTGIPLGATIPATRIIRMTDRSTVITICHPIR